MKKNYYLTILAFSLMMILGITTLFGQINLPFQSDFSGVGGNSDGSGGSGTAITATTMPGGFLFTGSSRIYAGGQKLKFGVANDIGILPTDVITVGGASNIEVKFDARAWPQSAIAKDAKITLTYGGVTQEFTIAGKAGWPLLSSELIEYSCQFPAISTPTSLIFKSTAQADDNETRFFLNNVRIIDAGASTQVANPAFSPAGGVYSTPQNVTISCSTEGATIHYTTNGVDPTTSSDVFSTPILVENTTTIKALAVKDGLSPSSIASATYTFPQDINTLAELRALAPAYNPNGSNAGTIPYTYTGHAIITQKKTSIASNQAVTLYIQDETAAIMVYDQARKLQQDLEIGDKITNISGTLTTYYGMVEVIPNGVCEIKDMDQQVKTTVITASQLDNNHASTIQAKVVTLKDVMYIQTGTFEKDNYYGLKENNITYDSVVYVEQLFETDYIGKQIPTALVNINGVVNFKGSKDFATKNRIVPLDNNSNIIAGISTFNKSAITLSPNPANSFVNIVTGSQMRLEVYGILGNMITTEFLYEGTNTISVSNYTSGLYLMKLIDVNTGQSYVQKLVVQ